MIMTLRWDTQQKALYRKGQVFDPSGLKWVSQKTSQLNGSEVSPLEALKHLAAHKVLRRVPVGIIGGREANAEQLRIARQLGAAMADHGMQLICGGKGGVMEAACEGHAAHGGLPVGILPDGDWQAANPFVAIPIATGIGPARNAIIARACTALIAVGGGVGTLSEIALGLQFKRLVLAMAGAPDIQGVIAITTTEDALDHVARCLLSLA